MLRALFNRSRLVLVSVAVLVVVIAAAGGALAIRSGDSDSSAAQLQARAAVVKLQSRSDLHPPKIVVNKEGTNTGDGLIFVAPKKVFGAKKIPGSQQGPQIVDDQGRTRWFKPLAKGRTAYDFRVQHYQGKPVLTWWEGKALKGTGHGAGMIYDTTYHRVERVTPDVGAEADIHEFQLTDRGTALMILYNPVRRSMASVGGKKNAHVVDGVVQEIDIKTGKVLFEWHTLGHVSLKESYEPITKLYGGRDWDYTHLNSVDVAADGNLLVSARHTWSVYKIDRDTGKIIWRLGGKRSDFKLGKGVPFAWQHDARSVDDGVIRIFDNDAASEPVRPHSQVITVKLDRDKDTATLVESIEHPTGLSAGTQGNAQRLPDGHLFVGWGSQGVFSEFDEDGKLVFDARVPKGYDTYRAFRDPWTATPTQAPRASAKASDGEVTVYASWNGATEVQQWQILGGDSAGALQPLGGPQPWRNLETKLSVDGAPKVVAVQALDDTGKVLATSRPVAVGG